MADELRPSPHLGPPTTSPRQSVTLPAGADAETQGLRDVPAGCGGYDADTGVSVVAPLQSHEPEQAREAEKPPQPCLIAVLVGVVVIAVVRQRRCGGCRHGCTVHGGISNTCPAEQQCPRGRNYRNGLTHVHS